MMVQKVGSSSARREEGGWGVMDVLEWGLLLLR